MKYCRAFCHLNWKLTILQICESVVTLNFSHYLAPINSRSHRSSRAYMWEINYVIVALRKRNCHKSQIFVYRRLGNFPKKIFAQRKCPDVLLQKVSGPNSPWLIAHLIASLFTQRPMMITATASRPLVCSKITFLEASLKDRSFKLF